MRCEYNYAWESGPLSCEGSLAFLTYIVRDTGVVTFTSEIHSAEGESVSAHLLTVDMYM